MNDQQQRDAVSKAYANAVTTTKTDATQEESCCHKPTPKGKVIQLAGYSDEEFDALPAEAVVNAFGCGNPLAFSQVKKGDTVLDLGSGAGIDILLAAKKVGPAGKAIGVDMTDEMIAKARENITASGFTNIEVRKGIIEELPVESASVDWVISNCVINLSPNKQAVFTEIARVLKPGGQMLVSDLVAEDLPDSITQNEALYNSCIAGAISQDEYIDGLKQAGLSDVEVRDRLVYDTTMLNQLVRSERPDNEENLSCCSISGDGVIDNLTRQQAGKIASINVYAKKSG